MEGLVSPFKLIAQGIIDLGNFFGSILDYINPFSDNFILKGLLDFLGNALSYLNPFDKNFILNNVLNFLGNILSYINPFSDNFFGKKLLELLGDLFKFLFVPSNNNFANLEGKFNEKFAFVNQIKTLFSSFMGFNDYGTTTPSFTITWNGNKLAIIDFSIFIDYRIWLHGIVLAIAWFVFIRRQFNKLPSVIGGFGQ